MDKVVICNFNLFDMYHSIELLDVKENRITVATAATTEDLGETIAEFCYVEDVNDIQLIGPTQYAQNFLTNDILNHASNRFGLNNLNIQVQGA